MDKESVKLSKKLSYILRHGRHIKKNNLKIDSEGWVLISDIQKKCKEFKEISINVILHIVDNNDKKRFSVKENNNKLYIRANQGHTIKSINCEKLLTRVYDPNLIDGIVHGTYLNCLDNIQEHGLSRMKRNNIHFAKEITLKAGIRSNADVFIFINVHEAIKDGIKFYESENGVILSPGVGDNGIIESKYFKKVLFSV